MWRAPKQVPGDQDLRSTPTLELVGQGLEPDTRLGGKPLPGHVAAV